jgi:putative PIN family toxin of toxin-antitoxin system
VKVILDTNVLISAIFADASLPGSILTAWHHRRFELVSSLEQIEEIKRVSHYPHLAARLKRSKVGQLVNELRDVSEMVSNLPSIDVARDPFDNFLLAMAKVSNADFLITGDKADLLVLDKHGSTRIVTCRAFSQLLGI